MYDDLMAGQGNILIVDESALHVLMHGDWASGIEMSTAKVNPLFECATTLEGLSAFNVRNPIYGPPPITLLVQNESQKRRTDDILCRFSNAHYPAVSFFALRDGLFVASPEFVYLRMARFVSESQLAEIGINLCGRYYLDIRTGKTQDRTRFVTTPEKLRAFAKAASDVRGSKKALSALQWVLPNSASPYETKVKLLFCHPISKGGFGLPFTDMNYDVKAGRLQRITVQSSYSIDLVDRRRNVALEYDGGDHDDPSADKRRRNELAALGWEVFPIDKQVLHNPSATVRVAEQIAKRMKVRMRWSASWERRYYRLRRELGLSA